MILKNYRLIGFIKTMPRTEAQKLARKIQDQTPNGKKSITISKWKFNGLIWETEEEIEGIYTLYLGSTHCENPKCGKEYKNDYDKCMDHCHTTNKFRNILCRSCNVKIRDDNKSGIIGIGWHKDYKGWYYKITINGKTHRKNSRDKEWLINYKEEYENKYLYNSEN